MKQFIHWTLSHQLCLFALSHNAHLHCISTLNIHCCLLWCVNLNTVDTSSNRQYDHVYWVSCMMTMNSAFHKNCASWFFSQFQSIYCLNSVLISEIQFKCSCLFNLNSVYDSVQIEIREYDSVTVCVFDIWLFKTHFDMF